MKKIALLGHLLIASLICFVSASVLQTQMVLFGLSELDINIPIADRLNMSMQDLIGLLPTYGPIVLIGLTIGFSIAKLLLRFTPISSRIIYVIAGGITMLVILLAMQPVLGVTLLAGARSMNGILLQMLSGVLGGICFMILRKKASTTTTNKAAINSQ
jgi:nucleoside recognition membrane protein YjiH